MSARRHLGRMHHRLTIMAMVRNVDEGGGFARADTVIATVWARVRTLGALEVNSYAQLQERATHEAIIRTRADVRHGQTLYWLAPGATEPATGATTAPNGTALYVLSVTDADPDGRRGEFLKLTLREGGNK